LKAAVYRGIRDVRVEDVKEPVAGKGEVLVKILSSNMCGTDLKTYLRGHPLIKEGTVMGHEYSGVVIDADPSTAFRKGDKVVGSNSSPCMECYICRKGSLSLCPLIKERLIGFSLDGSHSEFMKIPSNIVSRNLYRFEKSRPEHIACAEPLASVIHGIKKLDIKEGEIAAVIGSGAIGLMFLQVLKLVGAKVIMTNRTEGRLEIAERLGADVTIKVKDDNISEMIRNQTDGHGADVVIEAVGRKETWEMSIKAARDGGRVLLFGGCARGTTVNFDAEKIHYGERKLIGSFHHEPESFRKAVELIEDGKVKMDSIIDKTIRLEDIAEGFAMMQDKNALKVSIKP
jgi:L-iditol 2-dehydrogenase